MGPSVSSRDDSKQILASPFVTVILFVRNLAAYVEAAVLSVLRQYSEGVEFFVFDGGSTDGTVQVLQKYRDKFSYFASGPDGGPAAVINEGVRKASGDVIILLAGDDWLEPGALQRIATEFKDDRELDLLCCGVRIATLGKEGKPAHERLYATPELLKFDLRTIVRTPLTHGRIFRKRIYLKVGPYDETIPYTHDLDFLIRCAIAGVRWKADPSVAYTYCQHAGSRTLSGMHTDLARNSLDNLQIARRYLKETGLDAAHMTALLDLHARAAARCVQSSLYQLNLRTTWSLFKDAFRTDYFWPVRAAMQLAGH
jgi:glycosyltransferase involved in cell wall biosynthesis